MIFEQIERRQLRLAASSATSAAADRRVLSAAQVVTVRAFLADLRTGWGGQPAPLRNEFLRLILDRVLVNAQRDAIEATVVWRSGAEQQLWIERPLHQRGGKRGRTDADNTWLQDQYASSTVQALEARFPERGYQAIRRQAEILGLKRPQRRLSKPQGAIWSEAENTVLRAYATGEMSYTELCAQLPGRS